MRACACRCSLATLHPAPSLPLSTTLHPLSITPSCNPTPCHLLSLSLSTILHTLSLTPSCNPTPWTRAGAPSRPSQPSSQTVARASCGDPIEFPSPDPILVTIPQCLHRSPLGRLSNPSHTRGVFLGEDAGAVVRVRRPSSALVELARGPFTR